MIGKTVNIYGRNFTIYDADVFTKTFYAKNFGISNFEPINVEETRQEYAKMVKLKYSLVGYSMKYTSYFFRKFLHIMVSVHWKIQCKTVYAFNLNDQRRTMLN